MAPIDFTFYLGAQLINDYRRYAKYREIDGGKLLQKNELTKSNYLSIIH